MCGPAAVRFPWALGLGAGRRPPVRFWKVRVGRSSARRRCGDAWAGPDPEGVTRGFVSRAHPGTPRGDGGCDPGPGGILLGALLPKKFPEVQLRAFQLVLKEPSPTLHFLQLWPGERRSGSRFSCPRNPRIPGAGLPILGPCSSPGAGPSTLSPQASLMCLYLSLILACPRVEFYSWSPESLVRIIPSLIHILPSLISGDP